MLPNVLYRSRASDAWLGTETQSRDSVQPVCSARLSLAFSFPVSIGAELERSMVRGVLRGPLSYPPGRIPGEAAMLGAKPFHGLARYSTQLCLGNQSTEALSADAPPSRLSTKKVAKEPLEVLRVRFAVELIHLFCVVFVHGRTRGNSAERVGTPPWELRTE
jgi:hypothetical protein